MGSESKQVPDVKNQADAGEALDELLERGEISAEAYAEYSATADAERSLSTGSRPNTRQAAMFDHITLRVADLAIASRVFAAALDQLEIEQTTSTPSLSVWGNFALTPTDEEHPIARRVHVAFIAPTQAHVDRFWQAGVDVGLADDGHAGPRPQYADDYYAAFLKDPAGNGFEAVHRNGQRPRGIIDHVAIRVTDVEASTAFYSKIGPAAGLSIRRQARDRTSFAVGTSDGVLSVIAGEPTQNIHIAFSGDDNDVRRFHADATAAGYRSNGEPGERARYHDGYYAAYVLDPDGNNIEVVNHHR
jgi:catechol 2,3-dioxygenase-like lactoylglutathione lyase family enzyme